MARIIEVIFYGFLWENSPSKIMRHAWLGNPPFTWMVFPFKAQWNSDFQVPGLITREFSDLKMSERFRVNVVTTFRPECWFWVFPKVAKWNVGVPESHAILEDTLVGLGHHNGDMAHFLVVDGSQGLLALRPTQIRLKKHDFRRNMIYNDLHGL